MSRTTSHSSFGQAALHGVRIAAADDRVLAEHEHAADGAVAIAMVIGSCEWSPMIFGSSWKPNSLSCVAASPYQAFSRLTMYFGKLCHQPVGAVSCSR